jgi:hypothetical protein
MAEILNRGCAHSLDVATERGQCQVKRQYLLLADLPLKLDGQKRLFRLSNKSAFVPREETSHLHGERRGSGTRCSIPDELVDGAADRENINPRMPIESLIFIGEKHFQIV